MTLSAPIWVTPAGNIVTAVENTSFVYTLSTTGTSPVTYYLISGTLPPGIVLDSTQGQIYGLTAEIPIETTYSFTIRAVNTVGFTDRFFTIIVTNIPIIWHYPPNLGTILQNSFFSILLSVVDPGNINPIAYELSEGALPPGLTLSGSGLLSGYIGTVVTSGTNIVYNFSITANTPTPTTQNFTLTVTSIGSPTPQWNTIGAYQLSVSQGVAGGDVGNILNGIPYSFQLESVVPYPGGPGITYTLTSGVLPTGISLSSSGLLSGTLVSAAELIYPFAVTISDGINSAVRTFYIKTNYITADAIYWLLNSSLIPGNLNDLVAGQSGQFLYNGNTYQITKTKFTTTFDQVMLNNIVNNGNIPLSNIVLVTQTTVGMYNLYNYRGENIYEILELATIAPTNGDYIFNLGFISIGSTSSLSILATTPEFWVRYTILSGSLPAGLNMDPVSGEIQGQVLEQALGAYTFTVEAYNYTSTQTVTFSISVIDNVNFRENKLTVRIDSYDKLKWLQLSNIDLIPINKVFRIGDENFGKKSKPEINLLSDVNTTTPDTIFDLLQNEISTCLTPHTFLATPVIDGTGTVICEAVILSFVDAFNGTTISYTDPITNLVISPGSMSAMRQLLIDNNIAQETFENWMNFYFTTNISKNSFILTGSLPSLITGDRIIFLNQILPTPFENDVVYFAIPISATEIYLAASLIDALAGTFILFDINASVNLSGTFAHYFPGTPIAFMKTGTAGEVAAAYNTRANNTPFGYYTLEINNELLDVFFQTHYGHGLVTGQAIMFTEDFIPPVFNYSELYYVIIVDTVTFKLANSYANALANTAITIPYIIDDRTQLPFTGAFKNIVTTQSGTIQVTEADLRFPITVNWVTLDNHFNSSSFTALASNSTITLNNHGLETSMPIEFVNQTLTPELSNNVLYYVIVIDDNNFRLATTSYNTFSNVYITFSENFSGFLEVDSSIIVPINSLNTFEVWGTGTDSKFVSTQVSMLELGDTVTFLEDTNNTVYYIIPVAEHVFRIASTLSNAQNNIFETFSGDFFGHIVLGNNFSEENIRQIL